VDARRVDVLRFLVSILENKHKVLCKALRRACTNNIHEMVVELLTYPETKEDIGDTLIVEACELGHIEVVRILLTCPNINPGTPNHSDGRNIPLIATCGHGYVAIVELLLADKRVDPSDYDDFCVH
jgi:ankyrin repeat protein